MPFPTCVFIGLLDVPPIILLLGNITSWTIYPHVLHALITPEIKFRWSTFHVPSLKRREGKCVPSGGLQMTRGSGQRDQSFPIKRNHPNVGQLDSLLRFVSTIFPQSLLSQYFALLLLAYWFWSIIITVRWSNTQPGLIGQSHSDPIPTRHLDFECSKLI